METLEGRALLSQLAAGIAPPRIHAAAVQHSVTGLLQGPIFEKTGPGYVVKAPRFASTYTGVPRAELNAAGLKAQLDNQGNLVLTGIVSSNSVPIIAGDPGQNASYVFGIDRGTVGRGSPFPGRPFLTLDTIVAVTVDQTGLSGFVASYPSSGAVTSLPAGSVVLKQNALQVTVPVSLLASTSTNPGVDPSRYSVNFFTTNSASASVGLGNIASFASDAHNISVALPHLPPIMPLGHRVRRA